MNAQNSEELISVYIPTEGNGPFIEGAINGVNFRVKTGVVAELPTRIAAVIRESANALKLGDSAVTAYKQAGGKRL